MANFDMNNFTIDRVLRGMMVSTDDGSVMWSINQITNPSLNVTLTDTSQAVDALGSPIAEFDRGREAEFSAENSIFDLSLYAAQMGNDVEVGGTDENGDVTIITTPAFVDYEVKGESDEKWTLEHTPNAELKAIYLLNGDGTLGTAYKAGTTASATEFVHSDKEITIPTGLAKGDILFVMYDYEAESGVSVTADGINFPKKGRFVMEVLGADVCNQDELIHAYVIFPNAKLDGNVDYSFTTDGTHPFTIKALQDYCDSKKKLFSIVIPDEA